MNIPGKLNNQLTLGGKLQGVIVIDGKLQTQLALTGGLPTPLLRQGQWSGVSSNTFSSIAKMLYAGLFVSDAAAEAELGALVQYNATSTFASINTLAATGVVGIFAYSNFASNNALTALPLLTLNGKNDGFGKGQIDALAKVIASVKGNFDGVGKGTQGAAAFISFKGSITKNAKGGLTANGSISVIVDANFSATNDSDLAADAIVFNATPGDYRIFAMPEYFVNTSITGLEFQLTETIGGLEVGIFISFIDITGIDTYGGFPEES